MDFSFMAVQWLRKKPCNLTKALLHCFSEVLEAKQAEEDWEQFLLMRAKELTKGAKHVYTNSEKKFTQSL